MPNRAIDILLVEDNPDDAALVIRALKRHNLANKLEHLKNGAEAIDFIYGFGEFEGKPMKNIPRLILLDLKMPKVNGLEVLSRLKSDPITRTIPVVILTSSSEDQDIRKCYAMGANSYVVKPVEFDIFSKTIVNLGFYWMLFNKTNEV